MAIIKSGRVGTILRRSTFTSVNRRGSVPKQENDKVDPTPDPGHDKLKDLLRVGFRIGSDAVIGSEVIIRE